MSLRQFRESKEFSDAFAAIGDPRDVDDALESLVWSLTENPEEWPILPGFQQLRIAKTDATENMPRLLVFFQVDENGEHVHLLFIEKDSGDDE